MVSTKQRGGHVHTNEAIVIAAGRRRRKHSDEFKAQAVGACERPGVSMAAVALAHGINANLLRRWVLRHRAADAAAPATTISAAPAFVALALPAPKAATADIRIEIKRGATSVNVVWPASAAEGCAAWLRELLR
jgi:transposase-like protein